MCNSHKPVLNKRSMTHKCYKVSLSLSIHYSSVCIIGCSLTLFCQSQRQLGNVQRCAHILVRHTFSFSDSTSSGPSITSSILNTPTSRR